MIMPSITIASEVDYKKRTSRNINRLTNEEPLNLAQCFQYFNEPYMEQFFEIYKEYSCEPSAFLHSVLTTIGALSKDIRLSSIISHDDIPINLMTHVIGEPGEKSTIVIHPHPHVCLYRLSKKQSDQSRSSCTAHSRNIVSVGLCCEKTF